MKVWDPAGIKLTTPGSAVGLAIYCATWPSKHTKYDKELSGRVFDLGSKQAFRFMVGPGHCPMISKYGPSLSKAVRPVDPSFLVVKITPQNKKHM